MKYAVIDFETTGAGADDDIIQVGLVVMEGHQIIDKYASLVKPSVPIPAMITDLTGISDDMVADAPDLSEVMSEIVPRIHDTVLVGHNIAFDFGFLQRGLEKTGYYPFGGRLLDTLDLLKMLFPSLNSYSLSLVCQALGVEHLRPHQADSDAEATALLLIRCFERLQELPLITIQRLHVLFDQQVGGDLGWFLSVVREERELQGTVDPDAHQYYRGFALGASDWGDDEEPEENATDALPDRFDEFYALLKRTMENRLDRYEQRDAQERMIEEVQAALDAGRHLLIEAGTGTGKSMGYLIPALYHGLKNGKKIVVSTHTINLQEQLRSRDVPLISSLFPAPFKSAVLKGRSHYLCMRKFENRANTADFDYSKEEAIAAAQILVWLATTKTGDEEELNLVGRGANFWHSVASDADSCLNRKCPWFRKCYYHRARHEAGQADLVITNHSMLFTDIKAEHRILPAFDHLIVDESHHLEDVASKHLGIEVHYYSIVGALQALYKDSRSGQLAALRAKLTPIEGDERAATWRETVDTIVPQLGAVKELWDAFCDNMYDLIASGSRDAAAQDAGQYVLRLREDSLPSAWPALSLMAENIHVELGDVLKRLDKMTSQLKDHQDDYDIQGLVVDLGGSVKELEMCRDNLHLFMQMKDGGYVHWIEGTTNSKRSSVLLSAVPIDVSKLLQEHIFDKKDSVVMTSATLSVDKSFQYTADQLGFKSGTSEDVLKTVQLQSPFRYRDQALVIIPRDFPEIKGYAGEAQFVEKLIASLAEVAVETKGRMLVLFTSNRMLRQVHAELKERLKPHGIGVLGQGVDSGNRSKLTRLFQDGKANVLLGTSSFWEGVDIPGDSLVCLAIVRLPFQPPSHPLVEAKCENLKKMNKNPFMHYSVPQAVIRFKQGFGRLIRTSSDKGVVLIYDTRVIETRYGRNFLYSLPGPKIESMSASQIVPRIHEWMGEKPIENIDENI